MKKTFYILIVFVATILNSCGEKKLTKEEAEEEVAKFLAAQYVKETGEFDISKTYPFSDAQRVEILSYPDRFVWDTLSTSPHAPIQNGQIAIEQSRVKERIELSSTQKADLFNLLYNTKCKLPGSAACYDPRHAVIFFDKDNKAFAYIEICLSCLTTKESKNVNFGELCSEKTTDIRNMFKNCGIKYGLDGEDYWHSVYSGQPITAPKKNAGGSISFLPTSCPYRESHYIYVGKKRGNISATN